MLVQAQRERAAVDRDERGVSPAKRRDGHGRRHSAGGHSHPGMVVEQRVAEDAPESRGVDRIAGSRSGHDERRGCRIDGRVARPAVEPGRQTRERNARPVRQDGGDARMRFAAGQCAQIAGQEVRAAADPKRLIDHLVHVECNSGLPRNYLQALATRDHHDGVALAPRRRRTQSSCGLRGRQASERHGARLHSGGDGAPARAVVRPRRHEQRGQQDNDQGEGIDDPPAPPPRSRSTWCCG